MNHRSAGVLIGGTVMMDKRFGLDVNFGLFYKEKIISQVYLENGVESTLNSQPKGIGFRLSVNLSYCFFLRRRGFLRPEKPGFDYLPIYTFCMSDSYQKIIPMLTYEDGVEAIKWLCDAFGFTERTRWLDDEGRLSHGEIALGDHIIMLASPSPDYQSPKHHRQVCEAASKWYQIPYIINGILVYVEDVEKHFQRAREKGAVILSGLEPGGPGLKYRTEDLEGQRWMFLQSE